MVTDSRHRHQTSWTSFDTSPFFGASQKNVKDAVLDWSPAMMGRHGMQSSSPDKKSSIATVTTASTSASTLKEAYLYSPTIVHELQLDPSIFATGNSNTDTLISLEFQPCCIAPVTSEPFPKMYAQEGKDGHGNADDDNETDFSDREPLSTLQKHQDRRNSPNDPCLPFALDDLREMATASMSKAMSFWSQIQAFLHQKLHREDPNKALNRLSCTMSSRPTTVFIIPAMESEPKAKLFSGLESLADSLTNPTFLDDDCADDMSSLTEPPVMISKSLPPMVRYRNAPAQKWGNDVCAQSMPNHFDFYDEDDDYIEFETLKRDNYDRHSPRSGGPFVDAITDFLPQKKASLKAARSSLSRRFRTFLPTRKSDNQRKQYESTRLPKVDLLSNEEIHISGIVETTSKFQTEPMDLDSVSC